jgi:hypothetical protein
LQQKPAAGTGLTPFWFSCAHGFSVVEVEARENQLLEYKRFVGASWSRQPPGDGGSSITSVKEQEK